MTIEEFYQQRCRTPHNIDQHLPVLREYAEKCDFITELGTETGFSTTAFLAAQPKRLECYDIIERDEVSILRQLAGKTDFWFYQQDSLKARIRTTDLLFIDTVHTYEQVSQELWFHARHAKGFLVFHDIVSCPAIVPAIYDFMQFSCNRVWRQERWLTNQNGLAVYRREG